MDGRLLFAIAGGLVVAIASWLMLRAGERDDARLVRALGILDRGRGLPRARPPLLPLVGRLVPDGLFTALSGYTPALADDGRRARARGTAVLLALAAVVLATLNLLWLLAIAFAPLLARILDARAERRRAARARAQLDREVTGALDTFVLALEAGLPFDRAVGAYAQIVRSPLADELGTTVRELDVGYRRREVLDRLVTRTRSARLGELAATVRLAEDFGTPLAQALRSLAVDMRAARRQRLQEAALRAPITMLLPTAGFILVPIFAIVLGPIALRVATGSLF